MILTDKNTENKDEISAQIAEMEKSCFSVPWTSRSIREWLDGDGIFAVAYVGEEAAGYIFGQTAADECELYRIAVLEKFRRNGIASQLMDYFQKACISRGVAAAFLEVRASNISARRLYEKYGFVFLGTRRNYYTEPKEDAAIYRMSF